MGTDVAGADEALPVDHAALDQGGGETVGVADRPSAHEAAVGATTDTDPGIVDLRQLAQRIGHGLHVVEVDRAESTPDRRRPRGAVAVGAAWVGADDDVAGGGRQLELVEEAEVVGERRPAVHIHEAGPPAVRAGAVEGAGRRAGENRLDARTVARRHADNLGFRQVDLGEQIVVEGDQSGRRPRHEVVVPQLCGSGRRRDGGDDGRAGPVDVEVDDDTWLVDHDRGLARLEVVAVDGHAHAPGGEGEHGVVGHPDRLLAHVVGTELVGRAAVGVEEVEPVELDAVRSGDADGERVAVGRPAEVAPVLAGRVDEAEHEAAAVGGDLDDA